ncbi:MAG: hypothetical protein U1G07_24125 [Verrucomicrobiota bacterium]
MKIRLSCLMLPVVAAFLTGNAPGARAGTFKHIAIDGDFADWAGVPVAYSDPSEEGANAGTDFKDVWIAHDADYIYVRVSFHNVGTLLRSQNNVFVNGDGDSATGYGAHGTGSEMVIQNGTGYQEKNGGFNDGSVIQDLGWAVAPAQPGSQFEFRMSRAAKFEDGTGVFTSDTISLLLESENPNYSEVDVAKDDGPLEYTLDAAPPAASGQSELVSVTGTTWRFNRGGTPPDTTWTEIAYDDTQAGWESGKALFGKTATPAAYPAPIVTPFTDNNVTHYFRAKFTWDKDPAGLSLIASNFVSDGAIIYLNGAAVGRLRLGTEVTASTPATGANPAAGVAELIDLPANALIIGDNVLAVEVHQSADDTADLVFGMALIASDRVPAAIVSPVGAQHVTVDEGDAATFAVTVRGTEPITYQWFKGSAAISGAIEASYTIDAVTSGDAGEYQVKVSNVAAQNVASPIFTLEPRAVAVTVSDPNLPRDVTVMEGTPARFSVAVAGSRPISFQWFKDGLAIPNATNETYEIAAVLATQAGQYTCVISNRVTAPLTSRAAKLTVGTDSTAPVLVSAAGGGQKVLLGFSESVEAASVSANRFVITPSIAVTGAAVDSADPSQVVLQTATLAIGTNYTVAVSDVRDRFGNPVAGGTQKSFRASIVIDGDFSDWAGVTVALSDPQDAGTETGAHADYKDIWVTSDNDYIYIRFTLWRPDDPFIFYNNIFVDTDNDLATGYSISGIGSDMLIQGGGGYEEKAGAFNDGGVVDLDWLAAANGDSTEFEARISRQAKYADADAGGLVFRSETIALVFESENTGFQAQEYAPDVGSGGIAHTLINFEVTELGRLAVSWNAGNVAISWSGAGKLQSRDSLASGAWQDVANASSPYTLPASGLQRYFRLTTP